MSNIEKKHVSSADRERIISEWKMSGQSKKQFAEDRRIKYCTFVGWFKGFKKEMPSSGFTEIKLSASENIFCEVLLSGKIIRFYQQPAVDYFQQLLK